MRCKTCKSAIYLLITKNNWFFKSFQSQKPKMTTLEIEPILLNSHSFCKLFNIAQTLKSSQRKVASKLPKNRLFAKFWIRLSQLLVRVEPKLHHFELYQQALQLCCCTKVIGPRLGYQNLVFQFLKNEYLKFDNFYWIVTKSWYCQFIGILKWHTMCTNFDAAISIFNLYRSCKYTKKHVKNQWRSEKLVHMATFFII
jgi:hypothetical protein